MRLFIARHGQSEWNRDGRVTGQLDPALSEQGKRQANSLREVLNDVPLAAVFASPLARARDTATPTAQAHALRLDTRPELREIHLGVLQGRYRNERDPNAQRLWEERKQDIYGFRAPGGESFAELERRVVPCLTDILQNEHGRSVLIVGHRNTNRVLLGALLGWAPEAAASIPIRSRKLYEITIDTVTRIATISLDERDSGRRTEGFEA
jgi:broad specificity phosphatase PhoE